MDTPQLHRPLPRRAFDLTPISADSSKPPSPAAEAQNAELLMNDRSELSPPPSRTRSILNLTSSTLLGIYSNATDGGRGDELNTPWGTGAQTPSLSHRQSADVDRLQVPSFPFSNETSRKPVVRKAPKKTVKNFYLPLLTQTIMLFAFGLGFGSLLTHLHKTQQITPMPVPRGGTNSRHYQIAWGILGVILGNALPQLDSLLDDDDAITGGFDTKTTQYQHIRSLSGTSQSGKERPSLTDNGLGPMWYSAVRSVGAFAGIAFALRKIPWQSTLQVSLTLAVANPVLWYLIDRSKPGLALSLLVSVAGTFLSLLLNPSFVPVPNIYQEHASEKLGVFLWLASILFCTSLCFGAIGRRLQL
ncbi:hypothetical protein LTS08_002583 [Lithohypha guttulata]|uniref:uncharacterized protein n=1 Tax=Lithohypha guttulata TaxID=1690604 RepID=UPI002DDDEAF9|nr:hypothetical protein LTR51_001751 [Lithohypha guttulata]KAK5104692.1 hypothetical protein LTS08_002583 [Lithohypha guttulata]